MTEQEKAFWRGIFIDLAFTEEIIKMMRLKLGDDVRRRISNHVGTNATF